MADCIVDSHRARSRVKDGFPQEEIPVVEGGHPGHRGLGDRVLPLVHGGPCQRGCSRVGAVRRRGAPNGQRFRARSRASQKRDAVQRATEAKGDSSWT